MGPLQIVMANVLFNEIPQMGFAEHDEMVQALLLDRQDPPLDVSVEVRLLLKSTLPAV